MRTRRPAPAHRSRPSQAQGLATGKRCAVYARVSTEAGLDQEFNSLDAQREACEAYILSQRHEGWTLEPNAYADGGWSGGSLDRPDLKRLMADIQAGRLDVIVVYKVDRLTRSLADFAKLVDLFDAHGVSFVSVTQAFNTTTSMGRLTLNVLLSFAQFEREVTAERIRDKVAASRAKGLRTGGATPLGYVVKDKKLVPDEAEAATVRLIYECYLAEGSLGKLIAHLDAKGIVTKRTLLKDGRIRGGLRFSKGPLVHVLTNRTYVGEVPHKGRSFPGEHPAIVGRDLFDAVQAKLKADASAHRRRRIVLRDLFPLAGRIVDDRGNAMTPVRARKGGAHYRYYVSHALMQGRAHEAGSMARVSALAVERAVMQAIGAKEGNETGECVACDCKGIAASESGSEAHDEITGCLAAVQAVVVERGRLRVRLASPQEPAATVVIPFVPDARRPRRSIIHPTSNDPDATRSPAAARRFLCAVATGRAWLDELISGKVTSTAAIAEREGCSERRVRMMLDLAFTAPEQVRRAGGSIR